MSYRQKFGNFRITKLVFPSTEALDRYLEDFNYKSYVVKRDGKRVKKEGLFGLFYSADQRRRYDFMKIDMNVDRENNEITMSGYGHRRGIIGLELQLDDMYEDNELVSFIRWDNCARMGDDDRSYQDVLAEQAKWAKEQERRIKLFKDGNYTLKDGRVLFESREDEKTK